MALTSVQIAGLALAAASAAASAKAAADQAAAAKFQQAVALQNAERVRDIAALGAEEKRREGSRVAALLRTQLPDTGTALLLQQDIAAETEFQALLINAGGATEAGALTSEAAGFGIEAQSAQTQGRLSAGTTLLRGAGKAFKPSSSKIPEADFPV